jgi:F-type H+-transporting ATPase subunit epsilon
MAMTLHVDIVSAEAEIFSGTATMVFAPAEMGEVGIAPRHAPLLTRLKPGEVRVQSQDGKEQSFFVSGGMLEVQPHIITVLADTAIRAADIDEAHAMEAKTRAEKLLATGQRTSIMRRRRQSLPSPWRNWLPSASCAKEQNDGAVRRPQQGCFLYLYHHGRGRRGTGTVGPAYQLCTWRQT